VLFINFEIPRPFYQERRNALCAVQAQQLAPGQLLSWNLRGHACDVLKLEAALFDRLKDIQVSLIVVDPIYKVLGDRDENSATDMAQVVNCLERIALRSTASVVVGAHFSKGNQAAKDPIDRFGGSKIYGADPDVLVTLTAHEEPEAFVADFILRNLPPIPSFGVRWKYPLLVRDEALDVGRLKQPGGRPAKFSPDDLLEQLRQHDDQWTSSEWQQAAQRDLKISKRLFYDLLKQLQQSKKIFKSKATDKWNVSSGEVSRHPNDHQ
jgi:AAA domain